jgi:hypothetical protein
MFVQCAKTVAVRAALTDPHSCAGGRQPDLLSPTESRWIFLNIVRLHISLSHSLTHSLTHSSTLSLCPSVSHTPKHTAFFVLDFHGFFRVITLQDFIPCSYMEVQSSIERAKYGGF